VKIRLTGTVEEHFAYSLLISDTSDIPIMRYGYEYAVSTGHSVARMTNYFKFSLPDSRYRKYWS
jgi:hypothetical protein